MQYYPDTWAEIGKFNKDIVAVREYLREGDCTDMISSSDGEQWEANSIVQAIRSHDAIIVPIIGLKNDGGYNDEECAIGVNLHWNIDTHTISQVNVTIPLDFGEIVDIFEVQNGVILNISNSFIISSALHDHRKGPIKIQNVIFQNVVVSADLITRLFVLANTINVRAVVENNLKL